jgi:hypothetical protein
MYFPVVFSGYLPEHNTDNGSHSFGEIEEDDGLHDD